MYCSQNQQRPSWKEVFDREICADPAIYWPMHYGHSTGLPDFPPFPTNRTDSDDANHDPNSDGSNCHRKPTTDSWHG